MYDFQEVPNMNMLFPNGKRKALTFSYDDGVEQDIRLMELFNQYNLKCTFNLNGFHLDAEEREYEEGRIHRPLARRRAKETYGGKVGRNHEIALHSYSHPHLESLEYERCVFEITHDREVLESIFERSITGSAYPFGTYNDTVVDVLDKCGVKYARTVESTHNFNIPTDWLRMPATCHHNDPALFPLADKFINGAPDTPWLFYVWGHSYEFEAHGNWDRIEKFCELIANHNDVWYATNGEIYDYIKAYESLEISPDGESVINPSSIPVWIFDEKEICVLPKKTKTLK